MNKREATIDEILATFSAHISKNYRSPEEFKRNFELLLKGKRERFKDDEYLVSLEKNIVFLNDLVAEAEAVLEKLLCWESAEGRVGPDLPDMLVEIEQAAHARAAQKHRDAFLGSKGGEFTALLAERDTGGRSYLERLEFNYRYLMTMRIFLFEFLGVLDAVRSEYTLRKLSPAAVRRVRNHIEVTVHYYLGNVAVGKGTEEEAGTRNGGTPGDTVH
jgi:hypothetical protein